MRNDILYIPKTLLAESLKEFKDCYGSCAEALLWHLGKIIGKKYFELLRREGRAPRDFKAAIKSLEELGIGAFLVDPIRKSLEIVPDEVAEMGNLLTFIPGLISGFLSEVFGVNISIPALSRSNSIVVKIEKEIRLYRHTLV